VESKGPPRNDKEGGLGQETLTSLGNSYQNRGEKRVYTLKAGKTTMDEESEKKHSQKRKKLTRHRPDSSKGRKGRSPFKKEMWMNRKEGEKSSQNLARGKTINGRNAQGGEANSIQEEARTNQRGTEVTVTRVSYKKKTPEGVLKNRSRGPRVELTE